MNTPILILTFGDPGGIGPEVVLKSLKKLNLTKVIPLVVGSADVLEHPSIKKIKLPEFLPWSGRLYAKSGNIYFLNIFGFQGEFSKISSVNGQVSYSYIEKAVELLLAKQADGLVTGPISKESLQLAGLSDTGHTTMLKRLSDVESVSMAFYTPKLKTILTTIHVPFVKVPELITHERLHQTVLHGLKFCQDLGIENPRIAVSGLNPHAGENGMFGTEEQEIIIPFVQSFNSKLIKLTGPYPADTLYKRAFDGEFDLVVSLYHDQGLIPIKLLSFHEAVNVTIGLPFVRTSPDHGTAFDIAYKNKGKADSMKAAIDCAMNFLKTN